MLNQASLALCFLTFLGHCHAHLIQLTLKPLLKCHYLVQRNKFSCISESKILECNAKIYRPNDLVKQFGIGFFPAASRSHFSNETHFPLYAKNVSAIDFENYTISGIEYTLHQSSKIMSHGIEIENPECFRDLWYLFRDFTKQIIISLETDLANYFPTASIFGMIKMD